MYVYIPILPTSLCPHHRYIYISSYTYIHTYTYILHIYMYTYMGTPVKEVDIYNRTTTPPARPTARRCRPRSRRSRRPPRSRSPSWWAGKRYVRPGLPLRSTSTRTSLPPLLPLLPSDTTARSRRRSQAQMNPLSNGDGRSAPRRSRRSATRRTIPPSWRATPTPAAPTSARRSSRRWRRRGSGRTCRSWTARRCSSRPRSW